MMLLLQRLMTRSQRPCPRQQQLHPAAVIAAVCTADDDLVIRSQTRQKRRHQDAGKKADCRRVTRHIALREDARSIPRGRPTEIN